MIFVFVFFFFFSNRWKNKKQKLKNEKQHCRSCAPNNYTLEQVLYEYIPGQGFVPYQTFGSTPWCRDWDGWEIDGSYYMAIMSFGNAACDSVTMTNTVYKWNESTQLWQPFQTFTTTKGHMQ